MHKKNIILCLAGALSNIIALVMLLLPSGGHQLIDWGSPQGILIIIFMAVDVILILIGAFMKEKHLSLNDKNILVDTRNPILKKLQTSIDSRLKATRPLINKAEKFPLEQYWQKYLTNTLPYMVTRHKPKTPLQITQQLLRHGFITNNLHYQFLKENDANYKKELDYYNLIYAKIDDKELRELLNTLWKREHEANSEEIYTLISMNNPKIPNSPLGYRGGLSGKNLGKKAFQNCLKNVDDRIKQLNAGDDLI
jgi:hypothetical protein